MNKTAFIFILLLFCNCKADTEQESSEISLLKKSKISNYIDFEKPIKILNSECLNQYTLSLDKIIWNKSKMTLGYGVEFYPVKTKNKYHNENSDEKYVLLFVKEHSNEDTTYTFEAYYVSKALKSLKPCYFHDHSTIFVDSIYDIVPNFKDYETSCIIREFKSNSVPGVWELYPKDSLNID